MNAGALEPIVEQILMDHPAGLDEQAFLQRLRAHPESGLDAQRQIGGVGSESGLVHAGAGPAGRADESAGDRWVEQQ